MSGEIYAKPTTSGVANLAWATTASGALTEFIGSKRWGGWKYHDLVPYDSLNYRWNVFGEHIQYAAAPIQRRFLSLSEGIEATSTGDVFWADPLEYRPKLTEAMLLETSIGEPVIDISCDAETCYFASDTFVNSFQPLSDEAVETAGYDYDLGSVITSISTDGSFVWACIGGSNVYRLDRTDSAVSPVIIVIAFFSATNFISNGYYGIGWNTGSGTAGKIYKQVAEAAPSLSFTINHHSLIRSVDVDDLYAYVGGDFFTDAKNLRCFSLKFGTEIWSTDVPNGGAGTEDVKSVCTDGERVYAVHTRGTKNIECYATQTGEKLWNADAYSSKDMVTCFVDDKYVYVGSREATNNELFILDKYTGLTVEFKILDFSPKDADSWFIYSYDYTSETITGHTLSEVPKQFLHVSETNTNRRPYFKRAVPLQ